jgi:hypothetical protein
VVIRCLLPPLFTLLYETCPVHLLLDGLFETLVIREYKAKQPCNTTDPSYTRGYQTVLQKESSKTDSERPHGLQWGAGFLKKTANDIWSGCNFSLPGTVPTHYGTFTALAPTLKTSGAPQWLENSNYASIPFWKAQGEGSIMPLVENTWTPSLLCILFVYTFC